LRGQSLAGPCTPIRRKMINIAMRGPSLPTPTNPPRRNNGTREKLLAAAVSLLSENGSLGLTISALAQRAGMTRRTIYHHFKDRVALLAETRHYMDEQMAKLSLGDPDPALDPYGIVPNIAVLSPANSLGFIQGMYGEPRTWGVQGRYSF